MSSPRSKAFEPTVAPRPQMLPMLMTESNDRLPPPRNFTHTEDFYRYHLSRRRFQRKLFIPYVNRHIELRKSITVYYSIIGIS